MSIRDSNPLAPFLVPSAALSVKANDILRREHQRIISCGNLFHANGFILEHKKTGKIKDIGQIKCKSRWCQTCIPHREILQREKLQKTIEGFESEFKDSTVGLLTTTLPPLNHKLNLYNIESVDEYKAEADFRRYVRDLFTTHLKEAKSCSFVRGWFRSEEQTISGEKYLKNKMVQGNNLNLHFHSALLLRSVPEELRDEFEISCFFFLKWLRCFRQACKKFGLKPKELKPPYRDKNGLIRGGVVFLFKKSLQDEDGKDWFSRYLIKKSGQWGIASETTGKSKKKSHGFTMESLVSSKRPKYFKENGVKMLVLVNYNQKEFQYSYLKKGRVLKPKKTKRPKKSQEEQMKAAVELYQKQDRARKPKEKAKKKKKALLKSKYKFKAQAKGRLGKKGTKALAGRYNKKPSKAKKAAERKNWQPFAAVNFKDYYKDGESNLIQGDGLHLLYRQFTLESEDSRKEGRKNRKMKIILSPGESLLAS